MVGVLIKHAKNLPPQNGKKISRVVRQETSTLACLVCRRLGSLEVREMTRTISNPPTTSTNNQPNHQPTNLSINQPTNQPTQTNKQTNKQCQETEPEAMANTIYCVFFWEPTPPDSSPSSIACRRCRV